MTWVYLSPHLDDVALSCGGLVWEQIQAGDRVEIWTLCAGDPPGEGLSPFAEELHARWGAGPQAAEQRRREDHLSCARLGAVCRHLDIPDCIYRRGPDGEALYDSEEDLFIPLAQAEAGLVEALGAHLARQLPGEAQLVSPLTLGGHVDHRLTRAAAEAAAHARAQSLWYYADYPYVLKQTSELGALRKGGWLETRFFISPAGLQAWEGAVEAHASQISTFWEDRDAMHAALRAYAGEANAVTIRLWRPPSGPSIRFY